MNEGMFSSKSSEWETPQWLFDMLNRAYKFTLDPCCRNENAKCEKYYTEEDDGLSKNWEGETVFMNPPYGRKIGDWLKKAYEECKKNYTRVVCLVPARTDTAWWHDYVMKSKLVMLVRGRLKFVKWNYEQVADETDGVWVSSKESSAPFPSAIVEFTSECVFDEPIFKAFNGKPNV